MFENGVDHDLETHKTKSVELINTAAELASSNSAIVLGCGLCAEIPVRELSQRFESLELLDADGRALEQVFQQSKTWQVPLQQNRIYHADITGLLEKIDRKIPEFVADNPDPFSFLLLCAKWLDTAKPEFWRSNAGKRYDLIIVSTVLTQLQALLRERIECIFSQHYPNSMKPLDNFQPWLDSIWQFARRLETGFIRYLSTLLKPDGIIYLSATVHVSWLTQTSENTLITDGKWIATATNRLKDYLMSGDRILHEKHWDWIRPGRDRDFWGRLYGVQALIYQPQNERTRA